MDELNMKSWNQTQNSFSSCQPVYTGSGDCDLSYDYAFPDYIPDVRRLMYTSVRCKPISWYPNGSRISYEGEVAVTVLFAGEQGKIGSASFSVPMNGEIDCGVFPEGTAVSLTPVCETATTRLLNPRKLNVRMHVKTEVSAVAEVSVSPKFGGNHTVEDEACLEVDTMQLQGMHLLHFEEPEISVSEDAELDATMPAISEILCCNIMVIPGESRISKEQLQVSATAYMNCAYLTEDGKTAIVSRKFPISATIDVIGAPDSAACFVRTAVDTIKTNVEVNENGESKIIELDFTYAVSVDCAYNTPTSAIRDAYSTKYEYHTQYMSQTMYSLSRMIFGNFSVNESVTRQQAGADSAKELCYADVQLRPAAVTVDSDRKKLVMEGTSDLSLIATGDDGLMPIKFSVPYRYETDGSDLDQNALIHSMVSPCNLRVRLDSGNVYVDFEVMVEAMIVHKTPIYIAEEISFDSDKLLCDAHRAPMTLYYPTRGESVWEIAKKYHTTRQAITAANHMNGETITNERVILVPQNNQKASYSGIVE